jgi:hypothetical protein
MIIDLSKPKSNKQGRRILEKIQLEYNIPDQEFIIWAIEHIPCEYVSNLSRKIGDEEFFWGVEIEDSVYTMLLLKYA